MVNWLMPIRLKARANQIDYPNNEFKIGILLDAKFYLKLLIKYLISGAVPKLR